MFLLFWLQKSPSKLSNRQEEEAFASKKQLAVINKLLPTPFRLTATNINCRQKISKI
jgi:hypothetical protein